MADDMEELDPDLVLDMPEQQMNGIFGSTMDDELQFQHEGLSASDLGAGFGNIHRSDSSMLEGLSISAQQAPFSLADELADALNNHENDDSQSDFLAELERDSGHHELLPSIQSSPMRVAKSSRATVASSHHDLEFEETATNTAFEEDTVALQALLRDVQQPSDTMESLNTLSASGGAEPELALENLCSNLIRSIYDQVKQNEEGLNDLRAIQQDIKIASIGWVPTHEILNYEQTSSKGTNVSSLESDTSESMDISGGPHATELSLAVCINALSDTRTATDDAISSLAAMSELLQVNKAALSDDWRKIRATESGLTRLKAETESIQSSQELITKWERSHLPRQSAIPGLMTPPSKLASPNSKLKSPDRTDFGKQARNHLQAAQNSLEEASARALKLLAV